MGVPGGGHDFGESISDTVRREVLEETGIECEVESLFGISTNPNHVMAYDDGEVRQQFSIGFRVPQDRWESAYQQRIALSAMDSSSCYRGLPIHPSMRVRVECRWKASVAGALIDRNGLPTPEPQEAATPEEPVTLAPQRS